MLISVSVHTANAFATPFLITISTISRGDIRITFFQWREYVHVRIKRECAADYLDQRQHFRIYTHSTLLWKSKSAQCSSLCGGGFDAGCITHTRYNRLKEAGCCVSRSTSTHLAYIHTRSCFAWSRVCVCDWVGAKKGHHPARPVPASVGRFSLSPSASVSLRDYGQFVVAWCTSCNLVLCAEHVKTMPLPAAGGPPKKLCFSASLASLMENQLVVVQIHFTPHFLLLSKVKLMQFKILGINP